MTSINLTKRLRRIEAAVRPPQQHVIQIQDGDDAAEDCEIRELNERGVARPTDQFVRIIRFGGEAWAL